LKWVSVDFVYMIRAHFMLSGQLDAKKIVHRLIVSYPAVDITNFPTAMIAHKIKLVVWHKALELGEFYESVEYHF
jgi:hypothetical protein